jgi:hypothetical protein
MNRLALVQELDEARISISRLIESVKSGIHDSDAALSPLAYEFQHIVCHLARGWYFREMSDDEIFDLSQEEFERMSYSIPNWGLMFNVVDPGEKLDR